MKNTFKYLLTLFLNPLGRLKRRQYLAGLVLVCALFATMLGLISLHPTLLVLAVLMSASAFILLVIMTVKRVHDWNGPTRYALFLAIPFVNILFILFCCVMPGERFISPTYCRLDPSVRRVLLRMLKHLRIPLKLGKTIDYSRKIKVYDQYDKQYEITLLTWIQKVVSKQLTTHWDNPNRLADMLIFALDEEVTWEGIWVIARRYFKIETAPEQKYYLIALVMIEYQDYVGAERLASEYLRIYGPSAKLYQCLSRVYCFQFRTDLGRKYLRKAVYTDPNNLSALKMWLRYYAKLSDQQYIAQLEKLKIIDGSWLPYIYLAEANFSNDHFQVKRYFDHALKFRESNPRLLEVMSAVLIKHKRFNELFRLVYPLYDTAKDSETTGQFLLQACVDTKDLKRGQALLHQLFLLNRPDLRESLQYFTDQFDDISREQASMPEAVDHINLLCYQFPIWFYELKQPEWLVNERVVRFNRITLIPLSVIHKDDLADKTAEANEVDVVGRADEASASDKVHRIAEASEADESHADGMSGQLSRGLIFHVASEIFLRSYFQAEVLMPVTDDPIPIVYNREFSYEDFQQFNEDLSRYVLTGCIEITGEMLEIRYTLWDLEKKEIVNVVTESGNSNDCDALINHLQRKILTVLSETCRFQWHEDCIFYSSIDDAHYSFQVLLMEQLLSMHLSSIRHTDSAKLWGERNIIDNCFDFAELTEHKTLGLLFIFSGLMYLKTMREDIVQEYKKKLLQLIQKFSKLEASVDLLKPFLPVIYPELEKTVVSPGGLKQKSYQAWLARVQGD